jgi:Aspartyl protease
MARLFISRRVFLPLLLGAISLCCLTVHAQEPPAHKVPFTLKDNMIWIQAKVNGHPATLKIDTGSTTSVFDAKFQSVPFANNAKDIELRTAGGTVRASRGEARCEIGDLKFQLPQATYLHGFIDQGVIGMDVLNKSKRVTIDFENREIELADWGPTRPYRPENWDGNKPN